MAPTAGDGGSPAPIDRPILEFLKTSLQGTQQVERATISGATGHLELLAQFESTYYPEPVREVTLSVRWYTSDGFKIHYRAAHSEDVWKCRWGRHTSPHNTRDHFHPPPDARTPGEDASWSSDYRDVLWLILDEVKERITRLWGE